MVPLFVIQIVLTCQLQMELIERMQQYKNEPSLSCLPFIHQNDECQNLTVISVKVTFFDKDSLYN